MQIAEVIRREPNSVVIVFLCWLQTETNFLQRKQNIRGRVYLTSFVNVNLIVMYNKYKHEHATT